MTATQIVRDAHSSASMGHGQIVQLFDLGEGRWELRFSEEGKGSIPAPPVEEVKVEAVARTGQVRALTVVPGPSPSAVLASGRTDDAHRARIMVWHGNHFHTREVNVPGAERAQAKLGPHGGSLLDMGHDQVVEVTPGDSGQWRLTFTVKGAKSAVPPLEDVRAEAIGSDSMVRALTLIAGADSSTLLAVGRVEGASHIRLAVMHGDHFHTRSVPIAATSV